jgi:hypothetical protein
VVTYDTDGVESGAPFEADGVRLEASCAQSGEGVDERRDALSVEQRREVVRVLLTVTVRPRRGPASGAESLAIR